MRQFALGQDEPRKHKAASISVSLHLCSLEMAIEKRLAETDTARLWNPMVRPD